MERNRQAQPSPCPHCGAPEDYTDKYETRYACGTVYPYDWYERRSKKCTENEKENAK